MKTGQIIIILSLIAFAVAFGCSFANAIALPKGTDSISGVVTAINAKDALISIDGRPYYFKDASVMDTMLKERKISTNSKVILYFKKDGDKNQVLNIEINEQKEIN